MVVRLRIAAITILPMSMKFTHHKGTDNRPMPNILPFAVDFVEVMTNPLLQNYLLCHAD
jgi:hypothetical protein